jgi:hypothetical protein
MALDEKKTYSPSQPTSADLFLPRGRLTSVGDGLSGARGYGGKTTTLSEVDDTER